MWYSLNFTNKTLFTRTGNIPKRLTLIKCSLLCNTGNRLYTDNGTDLTVVNGEKKDCGTNHSINIMQRLMIAMIAITDQLNVLERSVTFVEIQCSKIFRIFQY